MRKCVWLQMGREKVSTKLRMWDKSGTPSQKWDKRESRENCDFPGHVVKNRHCLGKSGTGGHLTEGASQQGWI